MKRRSFVVGAFCFVPHRVCEKGCWARTDRCVAFVPCPVCKAKVGELCPRDARFWNDYPRRNEYQERKRSGEFAAPKVHTIVIEDPDTPDTGE